MHKAWGWAGGGILQALRARQRDMGEKQGEIEMAERQRWGWGREREHSCT